MGLMDNLEALGGQDQGGLRQALLKVAAQHPGGLDGLLNGFRQNGMGDQVNSWLGSGPNQNVSPQQVQQGLGANVLTQIAEHAGVPQGVAAAALSTLLPMVIDHLSPNGQLPPQSGLMGMAERLAGRVL